MRYQDRIIKAWLEAEKLPVLQLVSFSANVPVIICLSSIYHGFLLCAMLYSRHISVFDC